jgi:hypothetical protein
MNADAFLSKTPVFSRTELETAVALWLALETASASGDHEARAFVNGTFGPWASAIIQTNAS